MTVCDHINILFSSIKIINQLMIGMLDRDSKETVEEERVCEADGVSGNPGVHHHHCL